ncbi:MAG: AEC family transporter [Oscillospiraceae bacterium]|nr:AEC family transporter [Oscillospiraceae bacterium]
MDSLIYSLNATVPVFLVMVVGYILKCTGMLTEPFAKAANKFNFSVTLPAMLFVDLAATDIIGEFDPKYVLFCAGVTATMFFGLWGCARLILKDKSLVGEFVQASYRSSAAVLGIAFIENIYGTSGMAPVMIIGCVPLYNIFAVLVLTFESDSGEDGLGHVKQSLINIAKNPIIISIALGVIASLIRIDFPEIVDKTLSSFAKMASPLALVTIGAGFEGRKAIAKIKPTVCVTFIKLVVLPAVFLPVAVKLGFRDEALIALIIMLGSPTTPSSYIMAKNMRHEGVLSSSAIVATTLVSSITLTFWIFVMRALGLVM